MGLLVLKLVHIVGVVMLFGGQLSITLLFPIVARQADPRTRVECLKLLKKINLSLLMPGSLLAGITGFALAGLMHLPMLRTPWLAVSILLYVEALIFSMVVLAPASVRLMMAAQAEAEPGAAPGAFAAALAEPLPRAARMITLASTVIVITLMVLKPWP